MICPKCKKEIESLIHYIEAKVNIKTQEVEFATVFASYCPFCERTIMADETEMKPQVFYGNPTGARTIKPGDIDFSDINSKLLANLIKET